ncbi:nucleotidyl transferase AbiEii/AbiGii toxin family protein [uncultured Mucilaginibacter sp.]|uniref:nucleotidyl transferase AbiEii/AbiGii toxin family protein n=1 Tax=uncultured Mucilaginibacter sp. TaxID=797541 RepID=UPI0026051C1E|nr:nucleotidyl transferase AbiEii/AbiGii toxin family protein [uncultured Mucilaginibacter sp.]
MHTNIIRIKAVARVLSALKEAFVFVGGATVSLYATHADLAGEVRPTEDVDVLIEIVSYSGFVQLEEKLRAVGFVNDTESGVYCRYKIQGIIVDVMPTNDTAIGFSNKWYPEGFKNVVTAQLDERTKVKIFSLPYFIASKWEAYKGRGKGDYRTSKDFEDLVYLFENVDDLQGQLNKAPAHLFNYLQEEILKVIDTSDFKEGLYAHIQGGYTGIDANILLFKLKEAFNIPI